MHRTLRRITRPESLAAVAAPAVILAVQLVFFGMPLGLWLRGVVLGMLTALLAVGLALVYRANRVINFAQADLGSAPVALAVGLTVFWGWSYWLGLIGGLLFSLLLGVVTEVAIVRRFRRSSRLVLTVATVGIANLLVALAIVTPRLWGRNASSERISAPFDWTFEIGDVVLSANDLIAAIVAPLAMIGVALFLGATRTGLAVRAAAERGDRAAMLGIPVARLSTIVWALAASLSFLALFLQSTVLGVPLGSAIRVTALVQALAALVIGRMDRLPTIALTAITFGVLEYGVRWNHDDPSLIDPMVAAAVLIALLLQRRRTTRRDTDETSSWRGVEEIRPLTPQASRLTGVRVAKVALVVAGIVGLWLIPTLLRVDQVIKASGDRRLRRDRPVPGRAHGLGRTDLSRADGHRRRRRRDERHLHVQLGCRHHPFPDRWRSRRRRHGVPHRASRVATTRVVPGGHDPRLRARCSVVAAQ